MIAREEVRRGGIIVVVRILCWLRLSAVGLVLGFLGVRLE